MADEGKVALVTGANSGLGLAVAERLLHEFAQESKFRLILACRNKIKASTALNQLQKLDQHLSHQFKRKPALVNNNSHNNNVDRIQILSIDLCNIDSVVSACNYLKKKFNRLDFLVLNAGIMRISYMDFGVGIKSLLTNPANFFITGGDAFVQDKSQLTNDGLGDIFAANVFGHYIMIHELKGLLSKSGDGRVIWVSSTTAGPKYFSMSDIQCLNGSFPYESSKRLIDLLTPALDTSLKEDNIRCFVTDPGCTVTNITQSTFNQILQYLISIPLRIVCGYTTLNITPWNGAESILYLITHSNSNDLKSNIKYHSASTRLGIPFVEETSIEECDLSLSHKIMALLETYREKKIKN